MSEKNLLTEDVILEALSDKVIAEPCSLDTEDAMKIVLNHYDATFKTTWEGYCDVYYYTETTADGYEIWVSTQDENKICVSEDVYYYDSEWFDGLANHIREGRTIYLEDCYHGESNFALAIEEVYEDYWNDKKEEVENELIDKGYEYEN